MPNKVIEEGVVEAAPSNEEKLMEMLERAADQIDKLNTRIEHLEAKGAPAVFAQQATQMNLTRSVSDVLNRVTRPDQMAADSSVIDPLQIHGFSHKFGDYQVVEVKNDQVIEALRRNGELGSTEPLLGVVKFFTHRNRKTQEPKYRVEFRKKHLNGGFHESELEAYYG